MESFLELPAKQRALLDPPWGQIAHCNPAADMAPHSGAAGSRDLAAGSSSVVHDTTEPQLPPILCIIL